MLLFSIGLIAGGCLGVAVMACVQAGKWDCTEDYAEEPMEYR